MKLGAPISATGADFAQTVRYRYGRGCGPAMEEGTGYPYSPGITVCGASPMSQKACLRYSRRAKPS